MSEWNKTDQIDHWAWGIEDDARTMANYAKKHPEWFTKDAQDHMAAAIMHLHDAFIALRGKDDTSSG